MTIHNRFICTRKIRIIGFLWIVVGIFLLLNTAALDAQHSDLQYFLDMYLFEYLFQGMIIVKFTTITWITFLWFYGDKYNDYDVYLYTRYEPMKVTLAKWTLLTICSLLISILITSSFILFGLIYPHRVTVVEALYLYGLITLFTIYYSLLHLFFSRAINHVAGVFIPLALYVLGMILVDTNNLEEDRVNGYNYIQLIAPDIIYEEYRFFFLFGDLMVVISIVIVAQLVIHILSKKDWL